MFLNVRLTYRVLSSIWKRIGSSRARFPSVPRGSPTETKHVLVWHMTQHVQVEAVRYGGGIALLRKWLAIGALCLGLVRVGRSECAVLSTRACFDTGRRAGRHRGGCDAARVVVVGFFLGVTKGTAKTEAGKQLR